MTQAGQDDVLGGLAEGLQNLQKGEKRRICLSAERAYGFYDPDKVIARAKDEFPRGEELKAGDHILIFSDSGQKRSYRVVEINGDHVLLDGNHPLAGQDLIFEIETVDARDATLEEIRESSGPIDEGAMTLH
jgi:FKBP-type peptidyl-prolyl cis-trans isomerase SlyD